MAKRDIIVIGASAGGVIALKELVAQLPRELAAAVFIVQHVSAHALSYLPQILSAAGPLKAKHPHDGEPIEMGRIYVAPPDHHLLLEEGRVLVKRGPKENRFRPSIDALFRSAAYTYGPRVIGIVLTGLLNDGTSGLWSVKRLGGLGIIQEPDDALYASMPTSVLEYVEVDHQVPIAELAPLLVRLTGESIPDERLASPEELTRISTEVQIAAQKNAFEMGIQHLGTPTQLTCPECHGALVELKEGRLIRYRCHTGHSFTASSLLAEVTKAVEESLWNVARGLEETIVLLEQTGRTFAEAGHAEEAEQFLGKARQTRERARAIHEFTFHQEQLSEESRFNGSE
jgi:two-component system chemotaxis response regulator CheB